MVHLKWKTISQSEAGVGLSADSVAIGHAFHMTRLSKWVRLHPETKDLRGVYSRLRSAKTGGWPLPSSLCIQTLVDPQQYARHTGFHIDVLSLCKTLWMFDEKWWQVGKESWPNTCNAKLRLSWEQTVAKSIWFLVELKVSTFIMCVVRNINN